MLEECWKVFVVLDVFVQYWYAVQANMSGVHPQLSQNIAKQEIYH